MIDANKSVVLGKGRVLEKDDHETDYNNAGTYKSIFDEGYSLNIEK